MNPLKFEQIDHTADVGLRIYGTSLAELFQHAAEGLFEIITSLEQVSTGVKRQVFVEASDRESLLVNWLSELNFLFLTKKELYKKFEITAVNDLSLKAQIQGEKLDLDKHTIHTEVKAVTYHQLYIRQNSSGWGAQVIFDL